MVSITCCTLQLASAYIASSYSVSMRLTVYTAAVHGHLGQHQPQYPDGSPIMDDPGLIFFEQVSYLQASIWLFSRASADMSPTE